MATPTPFAGGVLPSAYPEAAQLPAVRQLLGELIDMQFQDLRVLLRLPDPALAPNVGCNFTAGAMMTNLISGFSIWFFHNRYARSLEPAERKNKQSYSARRFKAFIRAYYPRQLQEPTVKTIANHLYDARATSSRTTSASTTRPGGRGSGRGRGGERSLWSSRIPA